MNKDQLSGKINEAKGDFKEAFGANGHTDKAKGLVQGAIGDLKEAAKKMLNSKDGDSCGCGSNKH